MSQSPCDAPVDDSRRLINREQDVEFTHSAQHRILTILKPFRKLAERRSREMQLQSRVRGEEAMRRAIGFAPGALPLHVDEEGGVEGYSSCHGSSGGRSAS